MKYTEHYNLRKPEYSDPVDVEDFNFNADKIDAKLKEIDESMTKLYAIVDYYFYEPAYEFTQIDTVFPSGAQILNQDGFTFIANVTHDVSQGWSLFINAAPSGFSTSWGEDYSAGIHILELRDEKCYSIGMLYGKELAELIDGKADKSSLDEAVALLQNQISSQQKQIDNLIAVNESKDFDFVTDSTSAYTKTVPAGAAKWAALNKVGGKSVVWNQLLQNSNFSNGTNNWTQASATISVNNGVCSVTGNGSASTVGLIQSTTEPLTVGHKMFLSITARVTNSDCTEFHLSLRGTTEGTITAALQSTPINGQWYELQGIVTVTSGLVGNLRFRLNAVYPDSATANGKTAEVKDCLVVNLTKMYGSGNEPTVLTNENIIAIKAYAKAHPEYDPGSILSCKCDKIITADSSNETIAEYPIPAEVQALPGYGESNPENPAEYNYIDFMAKKFVRVGQIVDDEWVAEEEPVETDITAYLPHDNLIEVEAGGSIIFEQQDGTTLPIPSTITYWVDK